MTSPPVPIPHLPTAGRSQATAIEQSRAAAEVFSSVLVAHERPRSTTRAIQLMKDACEQQALAERAFYRYSRGKNNTVTGATVQLARELARCWGNINYGVSELRRDDQAGESEMLAFAWDLETNARPSHTFIVKHLRDTRDGAKALTDQRDIYENNANNGARRLREQIFACLPVWFVEQAKDVCHRTIEHGGGVPLPQRIAAAVGKFAEIRVTEQQLEQKLDGRPSRTWTAHDVAQLGVIFNSIRNGEVSKDDEFPPAATLVTAAELAAAELPAAAAAPPPEDKPARRGRGKAAAEQTPPVQDEEALRRQEQLAMEAEIAEAEAGNQP